MLTFSDSFKPYPAMLLRDSRLAPRHHAVLGALLTRTYTSSEGNKRSTSIVVREGTTPSLLHQFSGAHRFKVGAYLGELEEFDYLRLERESGKIVGIGWNQKLAGFTPAMAARRDFVKVPKAVAMDPTLSFQAKHAYFLLHKLAGDQVGAKFRGVAAQMEFYAPPKLVAEEMHLKTRNAAAKYLRELRDGHLIHYGTLPAKNGSRPWCFPPLECVYARVSDTLEGRVPEYIRRMDIHRAFSRWQETGAYDTLEFGLTDPATRRHLRLAQGGQA